jgi:hypothetical protein
MHEAGAITLAFLSADYLGEGGPATIAAGDPMILEAARTVGVGQAIAALFGQTALGFGVLAFGTLIAWAPEGDRNPSRWLGLVGLLAGVAMICTWVFLLNHLAGGGITLFGELAILVMFTWLGVWFLRRPEQTATDPGSASVLPRSMPV